LEERTQLSPAADRQENVKRSAFVGCLGILAGSLDVSRSARAGQPDVETDHIDAADDGGPRRLGVMADGVATALGFIAVEVDGAVAENVALSIEVDHALWDEASVYGAAAGILAFPVRFAFRGFYVHPRVGLSSDSDPASPAVLSPAVTIGYEWVCPAGCTLRLGGGGAYGVALSSEAGGTLAPLLGIRPALDLGVGWIF
jgi:hypothetical protein